jgi:type I restriction enzyme S subunit
LRLGRLETSTAIPGLNRDDAYRESVWIPPPVEQRAIVAKIESLFSELDQGVAHPKTVRRQLGRYRQSVLKAAFEGRLTAAWRDERRREAETNGEPLPTVADLLARIRAEREQAFAARLAEWERAVAAWEEAGGKASGTKKPRKPAAPKEPPPLTPEELADLPELPEGWVWCRLGLAIEDPQYGTSKKCRYDASGRSVIRIPNMGIGRIEPGDLKFAEFEKDEAETYELRPGDVLIIHSNGSVSLLGRPALITERDTEHLFAGFSCPHTTTRPTPRTSSSTVIYQYPDSPRLLT